MKKPDKSKGSVSLRLAACIGVLFTMAMLALVSAQAPSWWTTRQVTSGTTLSGTADYAAANQGQLKNIATQAYYEMQANLPGGVGNTSGTSGTLPYGGTGYQLQQLIGSWSTGTSGTLTEITGSNTADYAAVNIGQVKHVARLFYKRLIEAGFASYYPWEETGSLAPNDYAVANIGQIKNLFSFDLTSGTAADGGVPDMWEMNWFGTTGLSGTLLAPSGASDSSGNPMTLLEAYQSGISPIDYYNGVSPTLTIVSGTGQTSAPGTLLSSALVVKVASSTSGSLMVNAPVTFAVTHGGGLLAPDGSGTSATSSSLQVLTGTDGEAQVYFQQPMNGSFTSNIAACAEASEVDMSETTSADSNPPAAPIDVTGDIWPDGSVVVKWTPQSVNFDHFDIQYSPDGGTTWTTTGTTKSWGSYTIPPSASVAAGGPIRVAAINSNGTANSGSVPAIRPIPRNNYGTIDISGANTLVFGTGEGDVLSMALADSGTNRGQVAYCFASGTIPAGDGYYSSGAINQITVNTWNSGTTTSGTITCASPGNPTNFPIDDTTYTGSIDESLNSGSSLYQSSTYSLIQSPYILNTPPPPVFLMPNGDAYGTAVEACYLDDKTVTIYNTFHWSGTNGSSQRQLLEFDNVDCDTSTTDLVVNNGADYDMFTSDMTAGAVVLGCSHAGYFGVGLFGIDPWPLDGYPPSFDPGYGFVGASFICTMSGTTVTGTNVFYDPSAYFYSVLFDDIPGVTSTGTAFTPAAMNDQGYAIGGPYYWNGSSLLALSDTGAVGTAINSSTNGSYLGIGYDTASGTTGMLWLINSGSATPITMQSLVANTPYKNEIQNVIPTAISGTDSNNMVSILCSGSVLEGSGSAATFKPETLRIQVNSSTPSGTTTPPLVTILKLPAFNNIPHLNIASSGDVWGIGAMFPPPNTSSHKALVSLKADFKLRNDSNMFQGWDSTKWVPNAPSLRDSWTREPWTCVDLSGSTSLSGTNNLVKLDLSGVGSAMNLELIVAPGSESYISLTNNAISGTETDFNIIGLAATSGTDSHGKDKRADIIVREKASNGGPPGFPLATLHVYVLPPKTVHFAIFYCSDASNNNTTLPAVSGTQGISDDINATFNPQANVTFICDGTFLMNNLKNIFVPSSGELPCDSGTASQPPQWVTLENQSKIVHPDPNDYILWRIFVVKKLADWGAAALTPSPRTGANNFTFINASEVPRTYSHEAGRALQVSQDGDTSGFFGTGPFDLGPWPLEFRWDGLNVVDQEALMSDRRGVQERWIRHEYWKTSNENTNNAPFK